MDIFSQNKVLIRLVVILTVLNIGVISFFSYRAVQHREHPGDGPPPPPQDITEVLKQELKLTPQQVKQFKDLRASFHVKEREIHERIKAGRDSMNTEMFNKNTNMNWVKAIAKRVSENEFQMELLRIEQSTELKKICTAEQIERFEELVIEIRDYFKPKDKPRRR